MSKANSWNSTDKWELRVLKTPLQETFYYILNTSTSSVLSLEDNKVLQTEVVVGDNKQLWEMGMGTSGYYSLKNKESGKVLTAVNDVDFEMQGKPKVVRYTTFSHDVNFGTWKNCINS